MKIVVLIYKTTRKLYSIIHSKYSYCLTVFRFVCNGVCYKSFRTNGVPYIMVARKGARMSIGRNFAMNNGINGNPIGCYEKCTFFVDRDSELIIGENVGISQTALISHCIIRIGNHVKIGGGTCVYTTDFHSINPETRASEEDMQHRKCAPVIIGDNVFIGAKSIILKGVRIGKNSIVGAGSVVTKSIPENQVWAGNPAKFIRNI